MEYGKWRTDESKLETRVRISKLIEGQDMQTRQDKTRQDKTSSDMARMDTWIDR
jgi:hypothetical protein